MAAATATVGAMVTATAVPTTVVSASVSAAFGLESRSTAIEVSRTATRDNNGTTTFRDAGGRTTGTATAPRH